MNVETQTNHEAQTAILYDLRDQVSSELPSDPTTSDILDFAHNLFPHGHEQPASFDPFTILVDARAGKQMRCVEHSLIAVGLLQAYGEPARIVAGLALDPAVPGEFAGHVFVEYWNETQLKWVMTDAQWGITPTQRDKGLSALELREAFEANQQVDFARYSHVRKDAQKVDYKEWVGPYLDVFDTPGVLPVERSVTSAEHVSRFRMSLPRDEAAANQYRGIRSPNLSNVTPAEFYTPPQ